VSHPAGRGRCLESYRGLNGPKRRTLHGLDGCPAKGGHGLTLALAGWLATGSSSASSCAPSRHSPRRRSWSGAGPDTRDKLARHAHRTARAWSLDGRPLLGISVFTVLDIPLDELLSARFATYRMIHMATAARLLDRGFELLPTRPAPALHHSTSASR
jgi:hypothetical protein